MGSVAQQKIEETLYKPTNETRVVFETSAQASNKCPREQAGGG